MKKRILSLILTVAMMLSVMTILPISVSAEEQATFSTTQLKIYNVADLLEFKRLVDNGTTFAGTTVELAADIDLQGVTWGGIGVTSGKPFSGSFNGNGHTISNMTQTFSSRPNGTGGLFSFVRVPENSSVTMENFTLTGDVYLNDTSNEEQWFGSVLCTVDAGLTGDGGTFTMKNVHCSVNVSTTGSSNRMSMIGGMIGVMRQQVGLKPLTLNVDSCVYDGTMNFGNTVYKSGGIIGYTGQNIAGRDLVINMTNTVFAGRICLNANLSADIGLFVGYARGNYSTGDVELNVTDCISTGYMTFSTLVDWRENSASCYGVVTGEATTYNSGENSRVNVENLYYREFSIPNKGAVPVMEDGELNETGFVVEKTLAEIAALTANAFSAEAKFSFKASTYWDTYYPCPTSMLVDNVEAGTVALVEEGEWVDSLMVSVDAQVLGAQIRITDPADDYSGIRFVAEFRETLTTDAGTANANFGLILVSKTAYNTWSALEGENKTFAALVDAGVQVPAVKATTEDDVVTVKATVYNIKAANYRDEIVAIPYVDGEIVGEAVARSIFGVATDCVADANATTVQTTFAQEIIDNAPAVEE